MDSTNKKPFIIGTRGSLLALTQAGQVKKQLEELTGEAFEFRIIKTQGDQIQDKALWQIDGKDFFTKELDRALIDKEIDMVIHSYKDLGSERPDQIKMAAITKRQFPQDILLIPNKKIEQLKSWSADKKFIVGTSAPRRIENITDSLAHYLPAKELSVECKILRGNVNSRIEKLNSGEYDAIVLALAGLERLALTPDSAGILKTLTKDLNFKVLSFHDFPPAASQGALALEIHKDNKEIDKLLQCVHSQTSADAIAHERKMFRSYGGGCHLAVGIHVAPWENRHIKFEKGITDSNKIKSRAFVDSKKLTIETSKLFLGFPPAMTELINRHPDITWDQVGSKISLAPKNETYDTLIVTSSYCLEALENIKSFKSIWAAGSRTHKKLASRGHWVHGDSDSLGLEVIEELTGSKALSIINSNFGKLSVMSEQSSEYSNLDLIKSYKREYQEPSTKFSDQIKNCDSFYWTSYPQFKFYTEKFPHLKDKQIQHFCGLGKTYNKLKNENIQLTPLVSFKELLP